MRGRERRQSWRRTNRELYKALARDGRKWVKQAWRATAGTSAQLDALSPVTTVIGNRLVEDYAATQRLGGGEIQQALGIMVVAGYGTRVVLVEPTGQPSLRRSTFQLGKNTDVDRIVGDATTVGRLLEPVRTIACDRFESVMTLPQQVWTSYVAIATTKLQRQLTTKTLSWRELGRDRTERMLRYGYVLRCLDETLDAEPVMRVLADEPAA
jgi:hypothetical protein